jgi:hypothetical protein
MSGGGNKSCDACGGQYCMSGHFLNVDMDRVVHDIKGTGRGETESSYHPREVVKRGVLEIPISFVRCTSAREKLRTE